MSTPEEQRPFKEPSSPIDRMQLGLAALFLTPSKKMINVATDSLMKNCSSKRGSHRAGWLKKQLNNCEHTLIPVIAKMIHSAVSKCNRLILKDGQPLHMVKFLGAVRNFSMNIKHVVMIVVEDGTGLVRIFSGGKKKNSQQSGG
jgi:hypothetical protein